MTRSARNLRRLVHSMVVAGVVLGTAWAVGCNDTALTGGDAKCSGAQCSCEQDPQQPLCKGYNSRPEAGPVEAGPFDAAPPSEASDDGGDEGGDAGSDAQDAGDEGG